MEFNNALINMEDSLERFALSLTANREEQKTFFRRLISKP